MQPLLVQMCIDTLRYDAFNTPLLFHPNPPPGQVTLESTHISARTSPLHTNAEAFALGLPQPDLRLSIARSYNEAANIPIKICRQFLLL